MGFNQLSLIQQEDMKCEEAVIATMAKYWHLHYEIMFRDRLYFDFIPNDETKQLGTKLNVIHNPHQYDLLEKYHGIHLTTSEISEEFVFHELRNNRPVMTFFDQYYMPWLQEKDKTDIERYRGYVFVFDFHDKQKEFICIDVHTSKSIQVIDYQNFFYGCDKQVKSIGHKKITAKNIDCKNLIKESLSLLYTPKTAVSHSFDAIRLFAGQAMDMDLNCEFDGYSNIFYSPLSETLRNICQNTGLYLLFLEYVKRYDSSGLINEFYIQITELCTKWKSMIAFIFKNYYKGRFNTDCHQIVKEQILQIADFFESATNAMMQKIGAGQ